MAKDIMVDTFQETILDLVKRVEKLLLRQATETRQRMLVALAGVPGSGKSTVSDALLAELALRGVKDVAVVPMVSRDSMIFDALKHSHLQDGFHYTKKVLSTFKDAENAFRRRGAPFTFDAEAFVELVATLKNTPVATNFEPENPIFVPSFDHATKDPVADAIVVSSQARVIIVEGNYTLLNKKPWSDLAQSCEERYVHLKPALTASLIRDRWFVDCPLELVRDRLAKRHLAAGIEASMEAAVQRAEENDIPNGAMIRSMLVKPDLIIVN